YTLTRVLGERSLSLSSLDAANRAEACDVVVAQIPAAVEAGAQALCVISGPRPAEPSARSDALAALEDSLARVCAAARTAAPELEILIEPLDHSAHKRNTLGSTAEAVAVCERLAAQGLGLKLCLDTAHLILNEESPVKAAMQARQYIAEFHFCNCCIDRRHALFGDRHLPFGAPGVVDEEQIAAWMAQLHQHGFFSASTRPRVYCEVWKPDEMESMAVVAHCEAALQNGWELAMQMTS
ncbi:MAG: sugar phosphate isomerase/epimerase family protein, partial [Opitutaceae bacterium]